MAVAGCQHNEHEMVTVPKVEYDALHELWLAAQRMRYTAIVDDDYPEVQYQFISKCNYVARVKK